MHLSCSLLVVSTDLLLFHMSAANSVLLYITWTHESHAISYIGFNYGSSIRFAYTRFACYFTCLLDVCFFTAFHIHTNHMLYLIRSHVISHACVMYASSLRSTDTRIICYILSFATNSTMLCWSTQRYDSLH